MLVSGIPAPAARLLFYNWLGIFIRCRRLALIFLNKIEFLYAKNRKNKAYFKYFAIKIVPNCFEFISGAWAMLREVVDDVEVSKKVFEIE